jgi:hypothetical protein
MASPANGRIGKLGELADVAKGAADRAGSAIDEALAAIADSNKRIALMEAVAATSPQYDGKKTVSVNIGGPKGK